jgi:hypothetical protein
MSFPYSKLDYSDLGGSTTTFIRVSSQFQDEWINGIFHNSPYGIFCLGLEKGVMKLELISKGLNTPKFRKCKCEDQLTALSKIRSWMDKF